MAMLRVLSGSHGRVAGTSSVGLRAKNDVGTRRKPPRCAGMYGQSSGRGMCVMPNVNQSTTSVSATDRSAAVHAGSPSPSRPRFWNSSPALTYPASGFPRHSKP